MLALFQHGKISACDVSVSTEVSLLLGSVGPDVFIDSQTGLG